MMRCQRRTVASWVNAVFRPIACGAGCCYRRCGVVCLRACSRVGYDHEPREKAAAPDWGVEYTKRAMAYIDGGPDLPRERTFLRKRSPVEKQCTT